MWVASHANMGRHNMKTTIEIADDSVRARPNASREKRKTTFAPLDRTGIAAGVERQATRQTQGNFHRWSLCGTGLTDEFKGLELGTKFGMKIQRRGNMTAPTQNPLVYSLPSGKPASFGREGHD